MPPKMGCGSLWGETQAYIDRMTRALRVAVGLVFPVVGAALGCGDGSAPGLTPRPFLMGFSALPPRMDSTIVVPAINFWAQRADAAIIHASPPWTALLNGVSPAAAVETAWGRLTPGGGSYQGIAQDLTDFPFVQAIGLSSYPYLGGFAVPESLPLTYYSRIVEGTTLPVLVVEGGWPSVTVGSVVSSPALQARYIARPTELLDRAHARSVFQLTFYDLDLTGVPLPPGSILPLFTHLGLADSALNPKPALAEWDRVFARPYQP